MSYQQEIVGDTFYWCTLYTHQHRVGLGMADYI